MSDSKVKVRLLGTNAAECDQSIAGLMDQLQTSANSIQIERVREKKEYMDFGATVAIVVGSAAATAIAKGIADWMAKNQAARLEIDTETGKVLIENVNGKNLVQMKELIRQIFELKSKEISDK